MNSRPLWWILFLLVVGIHFCWEILDDSPPIWDMAFHQFKGWEYLRAWQAGGLLSGFSTMSTYYPPLYYLQEAFVLRFLPGTQFLALLSNLLGLFLLSFCTCRIAARFVDPISASLAGLFPLLFPMVAWISRLSLLDIPLAGWVAAGGYLVMKSDWLQRRGWSLLLGAVFAAGLLTKWTFGAFLLFPTVYAVVYSPNRRRSIVNLVDASLLAIPPVFFWYLPNLKALMTSFQNTSQMGVVEGDPGISDLLGWIYYVRCLSSYYLYLPLTTWLVCGVFATVRKRAKSGSSPWAFLLWWILGSLFLLTLLQAKDPRYVLPLAGPLAVLLVVLWREHRRWILAIFAFTFLQFLTVSFNTPVSPVKIALFDLPNDQDYRSMRQEWVMYQTEYFGVAGPPRRQDWKYDELLDVMGPQGGDVGFIPDAAHFNPMTFSLFAFRRTYSLRIERLGRSEGSVDLLPTLEFVVGKTGFQGLSYITLYNQEVYNHLEKLNWPLVQTWELPDRSQLFLWRNPTPSPQ